MNYSAIFWRFGKLESKEFDDFNSAKSFLKCSSDKGNIFDCGILDNFANVFHKTNDLISTEKLQAKLKLFFKNERFRFSYVFDLVIDS